MQLNKEIVRLSLPNMLSGLTVPLLGMVDMYLMGQESSELYMGAVALGGVIFNIVYWNFAFLRMSVSGLAAQSVGRKDHVESAQVLFRGMLIALIGSLVLLIAQSLVDKVGFTILNGSEEVKVLARDYFYVRIWAAPAAICLFVFSGWFVGMQNAWYPMLVAVLVNVLNVIASYIFVKFLGMQAKGIALGSVVAQYGGLTFSIFLFLNKYRYVLGELKLKALLMASELKRFVNVSGAIFFRTLMIVFVFTFFTSASAGLGDNILAANGALIQFLFLFSYISDGFANAAEALVGKYYGAKDFVKLKLAIKRLFIWGFGGAITFSLFYAILGDLLIEFFTENDDVVDVAKDFIWWVILIPLVSFATFILDGIYIGITASKAMMWTMIFSASIFFFLSFYLLKPYLGNHSIWLSMTLFMLARSISQSILMPRLIKNC